ncbi:MAG: PIN domain-containing protein [Armatimonadetes bacterium]|nr:PIN domain-containing protein [Armatimonadota bacterium]
MTCLVDTNVLLRFADRTSPQHTIARDAMRTLTLRSYDLCITPQNGIEFWSTATRPKENNGFGLSVAVANRRLRLLERVLTLIPDDAGIYKRWRVLVQEVGVTGKQVHDARLVAVMLTNNIQNILTFNGVDFARFVAQGITVLDPLSFALPKEINETL